MDQMQTTPSEKVTFLYLRVSTQDQKFGMESQQRALKEYCERNGIPKFEIFSDEGISGAKNSRPGLDAMTQIRR